MKPLLRYISIVSIIIIGSMTGLFAEKISALSPSTCGYEIGSNVVTFCGRIVSGADPTSFEAGWDDNYAVDKNHAYYHEKIIDGADPKTFQAVHYSDLISKDANHIFCENKLLTTDVQNFKLFEQLDPPQYEPNLSLDGSAVYYRCDKLENSDPKTFTKLYGQETNSTDDGFYKDKNNVYYHQYRFYADADSFHDLGNGYAKDKNAIYFNDKGKVHYADLKSFHVNVRYYGAEGDNEKYRQLDAECGNKYYDAYDDNACYSHGDVFAARNKGAVIGSNP